MKEKIKENKTKIIGWYNEPSDRFFCLKCFADIKELDKKNMNQLKKDL